jgi:hypothetical protein
MLYFRWSLVSTFLLNYTLPYSTSRIVRIFRSGEGDQNPLLAIVTQRSVNKSQNCLRRELLHCFAENRHTFFRNRIRIRKWPLNVCYTEYTQKNGGVSKVNKKFISVLRCPDLWLQCTKVTLHCNHRSGHLKTEHTERLLLLRRHLGNRPRGMRSELLVAHEKLGQLPLLTVLRCARVRWEINFLLTFETAPFFCVYPV